MADFNFTLPDLSGVDFSAGFPFSGVGSDPLGGGGSIVSPPIDLGGATSGLSDLFGNIAQLVNVAYQGEAQVQQQKYLNKIATAKLANQLDTVRSAPNLWVVLGIGAAGLFALELIDRGKR